MKIFETKIPGCLQVSLDVHQDARGNLIKLFQAEQFREHHLLTDFSEDFYSTSYRGVLRGLHFQVPPADYTKIVCCLQGKVFDAVVDLRKGSPTFGQPEIFQLDSAAGCVLYLPPGLAHGFYVLSEQAIILYKTSSFYVPRYDGGVHWDSLGIPWPDKNPLISARDAQLPDFKNFASPFVYEKR